MPGQIFTMPWGDTHLYCSGSKDPANPTIILQSGLDLFGSMSWATVHAALAESLRTCAYDRAGIMWSEHIGAAQDANVVAQQLHDLLLAANEQPPFLIAGHSMGGLMAIVYAAKYPDQVEGLVLIDSSHPKQMERLPAEAVASEGAPPPGWLINLAAFTGVLRLADPFPATPLPASVAPAKLFTPISIRGLVNEVQALPAITQQAGAVDLPDTLPVTVLSRSEPPLGLESMLSLDVIRRTEDIWHELQIELSEITDCGENHSVKQSSHYVHHDQPQLVVDAIVNVAHKKVPCQTPP